MRQFLLCFVPNQHDKPILLNITDDIIYNESISQTLIINPETLKSENIFFKQFIHNLIRVLNYFKVPPNKLNNFLLISKFTEYIEMDNPIINIDATLGFGPNGYFLMNVLSIEM